MLSSLVNNREMSHGYHTLLVPGTLLNRIHHRSPLVCIGAAQLVEGVGVRVEVGIKTRVAAGVGVGVEAELVDAQPPIQMKKNI